MVDGVHGYVSHVARHVVVEYRTLLENVTIRDLCVEVIIAVVAASVKRNAMIFVAQVKCTMIILLSDYTLSSKGIQLSLLL